LRGQGPDVALDLSGDLDQVMLGDDPDALGGQAVARIFEVLVRKAVGDFGDVAEPEDAPVGMGAQHEPEEPVAVVSRVLGAQLEFARGRLELAARQVERAFAHGRGDLG